MSLSVGIVGLPNVGKSTLFNALLKKQQAYVANFPFATIEPNVGVVPVPDERLVKLSETVKASEKLNHLPPVVPATVQFVDIAGLIAGAHKGEGLGNKFLHHIREVDAVCHVLRLFNDPEVTHLDSQGEVDARRDFETVKTELELADLETKERRDRANAKAKAGKEKKEDLPLFSKKPTLVVLNVDEEDLKKASELEMKYAAELDLEDQARLAKDGESRRVVAICAKTEAQLAELSEEDQKKYLEDLGVHQSGLEKLIKKAFLTLGLISFLTAGEKEVRAWTIRLGSTALSASGVIHTDFMDKFIKADVVDFKDFVKFGGWAKCRELGKVRSEGRDYIIADGDVIEFKIGA